MNWVTIKSPRVFLVRFRHRHHRRLRRLRRRRSTNTFQLSGKTPEANFFKPHMVDLWVWEHLLAPISVTLGQGHKALVMLSTWLNMSNFLRKILNSFSPVEHSMGPILFTISEEWLVQLMWNKKEMS